MRSAFGQPHREDRRRPDRGDASWRISVLDDGFGIEPQNQGPLFKRFARIETDANATWSAWGSASTSCRSRRAHGGQVLSTAVQGPE